MGDPGDRFPEHTKLRAVKEKSQACGDFIAWLRDTCDVTLCVWDKTSQHYEADPTSITTRLAEFFDIDRKKLEAEKQAMYAELSTRAEKPEIK